MRRALFFLVLVVALAAADIVDQQYQHMSVSYGSARQYCLGRGLQLCTRDQLCQGGAGGQPRLGRPAGDHWTPTRDSDNSWISIGTANDHRLCNFHEVIEGGRHGKPGWGNSVGAHPVACCTGPSSPYKFERFSYAGAAEVCRGMGKQLCSRKEICGDNNTPKDGRPEGDHWLPTRDSDNSWLSIGTANPERVCRFHQQVDGGIHGKPSWGGQAHFHPLICCDAPKETYKFDEVSWSTARQTCKEQGKDLCSRAQICPDDQPKFGRPPGDHWFPTRDGENSWISIGTAYNERLCKFHHEIDGGRHGRPAWGTSPGRHPTYCCDVPKQEYKFMKVSWGSAREYCKGKGKDLCMAKDVCKQGSPLAGRPDGDHWLPTRDSDNSWVSVGKSYDERLCKFHQDIDGGKHGKPVWGGLPIEHPVLCCVPPAPKNPPSVFVPPGQSKSSLPPPRVAEMVFCLKAWPFFCLSARQGAASALPAGITWLWNRVGEFGNDNQRFRYDGTAGTVCLSNNNRACLTAIDGTSLGLRDPTQRRYLDAADSVGLTTLQNGNANQLWIWKADKGRLCLRSNPRKCLATTAGQVYNGARLVLVDASVPGNSNERFWVATEKSTCEKGEVPCGPNAACVSYAQNTHSCVCKAGYTGDGSRCEEIDNCKKAQNPCAADGHAVCVKTGPAQHDCVCAKGYKKRFGRCQEVNPCTDYKTNPCDKNAVCTKTGPGLHKCSCNPGYKMGANKKCVEINPCDTKPCQPNANCLKSGPGSYRCECKKGYRQMGKTCEEIDACASNPCDNFSKCIKTGPGGFTCQCNKGYKPNGKRSCIEIDACAAEPCDKNALCKKTGPGAYKCECKRGYKGDGIRGGSGCRDIDPCLANPGPCDKNAACKHTAPGKHKCTCNPGWEGDGTFCKEVDPCLSQPCSPDAICTKKSGGRYSCKCKPDYTGDGRTCKPIDNCALTPRPCDANADCINLGPGKHRCQCKFGFNMLGTRCVEIDVCKSNPCHKNAVCLKGKPGEFKCKCNKGYKGNGQTCEPINPCTKEPGPCDVNAVCTMTGPGLHTCTCNPGYKATKDKKCVEIDICEVKNPCDKDAICTKTGPGTASCECKTGFKPSADGHRCLPVNMCKPAQGQPNPCDKNALCIFKGPGQYACQCKKGWTGDGTVCEEADPCASGPCPDSNSVCIKTGFGKFQCQCMPGFEKAGSACAPIDACKSHPCDGHGSCTSTGPGTYTCTCAKGYQLATDNRRCLEIDACASNPCDSNANCKKTGPGLFACTCKKGYEGTGTACVESDPCKSNPCDIHAQCKKTGFAKFKCFCDDGYTGDGLSCKEVNSCLSDPCDPNALCIKTGPGTHQCVCKAGFRQNAFDANKCDEINPCRESNPCDAHATCKKTGPGAFSCTCKPGYTADGNRCLEINSCAKLPYPCHKEAQCLRTGPGTHVCACNQGFKGDGVKSCLPTPEQAAIIAQAEQAAAAPIDSSTSDKLKSLGLDATAIGATGLDPKALAAVMTSLGLTGPLSLPTASTPATPTATTTTPPTTAVPTATSSSTPATPTIPTPTSNTPVTSASLTAASDSIISAERSRKIEQLQARIMQYQALRAKRKQTEQSSEVDQLEKRVETIASSAKELAASKQRQIELLRDLKKFQEDQDKKIKDLVAAKTAAVLQAARDQLAHTVIPPAAPKPAPTPVAAPSLPDNQKYVDHAAADK